jgi:alcohol dehydrogenase YqhD (iron-dependent ADH family)
MKSFDFSAPDRVFFGNAELRRLQEIAPITGKSAMLLAAKQTMKQTGILDRAVDSAKAVVSRADVVQMYRDSL